MKLYSVKLPAGTYIGLDLATKSGFAVIQSDGVNVELVDYSSLSLPKSTTTSRLVFTGRAVRALMEKPLSSKVYYNKSTCIYRSSCQSSNGKVQRL